MKVLHGYLLVVQKAHYEVAVHHQAGLLQPGDVRALENALGKSAEMHLNVPDGLGAALRRKDGEDDERAVGKNKVAEQILPLKVGRPEAGDAVYAERYPVTGGDVAYQRHVDGVHGLGKDLGLVRGIVYPAQRVQEFYRISGEELAGKRQVLGELLPCGDGVESPPLPVVVEVHVPDDGVYHVLYTRVEYGYAVCGVFADYISALAEKLQYGRSIPAVSDRKGTYLQLILAKFCLRFKLGEKVSYHFHVKEHSSLRRGHRVPPGACTL